jgi:putative transposase
MMIIRKGYKYRFRTTKEIEHTFLVYSGQCRYVWNKALAMQMNRLDGKVPVLRYQDMAGLLVLWKKSEEMGFLKDAPSQVLQQILKDLDRALWDGLSGKKGMPRFRKKGLHDSFRFPQGFRIEGDRVFLPKIGWMRFIKSREIEGTAKNVTVSRRGKHWYVSIQAEREVAESVHPSSSATGIDMGIARFLTHSDGTFVEPLNSFRGLEEKLAREQRKLSRKKLHSRNWHKQHEKIARLHIRIVDARTDFLHKHSTAICKSHAVVVMEDLRVMNMSASASGTLEEPGRNVKAKSGLNKSILDQGWYTFRKMIEYKLGWLGGELVLVPPQYTSLTCPRCKNQGHGNRPSQSEFRCTECGFEAHADHVGAMNILRAGLARIACGVQASEETSAQEPAGNGDQYPLPKVA